MFRQRRTGIRGRIDLELAVQALDKPCPARAEIGRRFCAELLFEPIKRSPLLFNSGQQIASRSSAAIGRQALPEKGVVVDLSCIVEDRALTRFDDFSERFGLVLSALDEVVEIIDVRLVMLAIVVLHGFFTQCRSKRVQLVVKLG